MSFPQTLFRTSSWADNTPLDYVSWGGGEPNDAFGAERCGQIQAFNGKAFFATCNK